jgi:hypothetical protein
MILTITAGKRTRRVSWQAAPVEALPSRPSVRLRRPDAFLRRCRRIFASPMRHWLVCMAKGFDRSRLCDTILCLGDRATANWSASRQEDLVGDHASDLHHLRRAVRRNP